MTDSAPKLVAVDDVNAIPVLAGKDLAAIVRRHFRRQYPGVKVSVTSANQTIRLAWTDGPGDKAIAAEYAWARGVVHDTMADCVVPRGAVPIAGIGDDQVRAELAALTGGLPMFRTYNHWLFTSRSYSRTAWDLVAAEIKRQCGVEIDRNPDGTVADTVNGRPPQVNPVLKKGHVWLGMNTDYFSNVARTWLSHTDITEPEQERRS